MIVYHGMILFCHSSEEETKRGTTIIIYIGNIVLSNATSGPGSPSRYIYKYQRRALSLHGPYNI